MGVIIWDGVYGGSKTIPLSFPNMLACVSAEDSFFGELYILHGVAISVCLKGFVFWEGFTGTVIR